MIQTPADALEKRKSAYYREAAKAFLDRRGAPFLLSARDVALIAEWEKRGIPLGVVLEGIERAFEGGGTGRHPAGKVMSLAFCGPQVEKAFARHRDRRAGAEVRVRPRAEKKERAAAEVNRFLASLPPGADEVRPLFVRAADILAAEVPDEEALERIDAEVDAKRWSGPCPRESRRTGRSGSAKSIPDGGRPRARRSSPPPSPRNGGNGSRRPTSRCSITNEEEGIDRPWQ
jgi:hypothetical protein